MVMIVYLISIQSVNIFKIIIFNYLKIYLFNIIKKLKHFPSKKFFKKG